MSIEPEPNLETSIHRQLRALPEKPAPATLIPRVMAVIEARARQWWRQPWLDWPRAAQVISSAALLIILGVASWWSYAEGPAMEVEQVPETLLDRFPLVEAIWGFCASLINGLLAVVQANQTWVMYGLMIVFLMYLACIGIGTAFFRVAYNKHSDR